MERLNWINPLLRVIYIALLGVLLPHTAWAFAVWLHRCKPSAMGAYPVTLAALD